MPRLTIRSGPGPRWPIPTAAPPRFSHFFTDGDGIDPGHGSFTLGTGEQTAGFLHLDPFNGSAEMRGTFTFGSSLPVPFVALHEVRTERPEFLMAALPVVPLAAGTAGTVHFPHFASGAGWTAQVFLVNPTHAPVAGSFHFLGSDSATAAGPATLTLAERRTGSAFLDLIPPRGAVRLRTAGKFETRRRESVSFARDFSDRFCGWRGRLSQSPLPSSRQQPERIVQ